MSTSNESADSLRLTRGYPSAERAIAVQARALVGGDNSVVIDPELLRTKDPTGVANANLALIGTGGAVTQITSRTTGVTVDALAGAITLVSAAGSATPFSFTVTNSTVGVADTVDISQKSGADKYTTQVITNVAAGSFQVTLANASGTTTEQPVFNFHVNKGATS